MTYSRFFAIAVLTLGVGCAEYDLATADIDDPTEGDDATGFLRIDVYPALDPETAVELQNGDNLVVQPRFLQQTLRIDTPQFTDLDLRLAEPLTVQGLVTGYEVTPWADAELPGGTDVIAGARVNLHKKSSIQSPFTTTLDDGSFQLRVAPELTPYRFSITPDNPELPLTVGYLQIDESLDEDEDGILTIDTDLGSGTALYGTVETGDGLPRKGISVVAMSEDGVESAAALTDEDGRYLLRVQPDQAYSVSASGIANLDPVLTAEPLTVGPEGARVDLVYGNLEQVNVNGFLAGPEGQGVFAARVRFTALELYDYTIDAQHVVEVVPNAGTFSTRLLAGRYQVTVAPDEGLALSPLDYGEIDVTATMDLPQLTLPALRPQNGLVVDGDEVPVAGAQITATEIGFGQRSWSTTTTETGNFFLDVPDVPLEYTLTPPSARSDLALTRVAADGASDAPTLEFATGGLVSGTVTGNRLDGSQEPLPFAVVEVRNDSGRLLGVALTDSEGGFRLRVDLPPI